MPAFPLHDTATRWRNPYEFFPPHCRFPCPPFDYRIDGQTRFGGAYHELAEDIMNRVAANPVEPAESLQSAEGLTPVGEGTALEPPADIGGRGTLW